MANQRSQSALAHSVRLGVCVILLQGTISAPARAGRKFRTGQVATPAFASADCTSVAVDRITSAPDEDVLTTLPGNVHPLAQAEFDRGAVPDDLPMEQIWFLLQADHSYLRISS